MYVLLVSSSYSPATLKAALNLAKTSMNRGHRVTLFFNEDSTRLLAADRLEAGLAALASRGVRLLACRTSVLEWGLAEPGALMEGAEISSLGELVELMEDADRVLFLG
ncbi:MAG: DsrE family protein [Candidatus Bathyarchaeota archaeon]|nr:MAG: DsrE family protein [Candidatus Bathyarchaeota archaeon]